MCFVERMAPCAVSHSSPPPAYCCSPEAPSQRRDLPSFFLVVPPLRWLRAMGYPIIDGRSLSSAPLPLRNRQQTAVCASPTRTLPLRPAPHRLPYLSSDTSTALP